jgi:UPF0755 protein
MKILTKASVLGFSLLFLVIGTLVVFFNNEFNRSANTSSSRVLIIPKGSGLNDIAQILNENGILRYSLVFVVGAKLLSLSRELKAGEYNFPPGVSAREILNTLSSGKTLIRRITVPEGLTSSQIVVLLNNTESLAGSITEIPREGSLLPETYNYSWGDSRAKVIERMQQGMSSRLPALWRNRDKTIPIKNISEAVILASIIEKETSIRKERFLIASVFINRLQRNMRLQSDPTVVYGLPKKMSSRLITRADLNTKTPHNTYRIMGLPKTPICNPGVASIEAALNPAKAKFFYFVASGNGQHAFSKTLSEHNKNVRKWRIFNNKKKDK